MIKKYLPFFQRNMPPLLNAMIIIGIGIIFAPFQPIPPKLFMIGLYLLYVFFVFVFNNNRDLGMAMMGTYWKTKYPQANQLVYAAVSTLSFASIFYYVFFPFDLLLFNIALLQVPSLFFRGMTFQAYIAGRMEFTTSKLP